ncbi:Gfo/Idh/MocA family protein [Alicyclobacillus ferrooxydans]|uniref:Dehydrogenase n=1 Tax=Alicyclobacillus ferrooxydans TaxID=471514 RepID=A0A0P9CLQ3_9BACL|nr:Gfo/Idh/MocA family oxidoreductase [Alicyclobacillus ferrooxydans]KPV43931.1 dehydrogenase [Alicyclobacillus ferrooxydans]
MKFAIFSFAHMHAYSYAQALQHIHDAQLTVVADSHEERGEAAARKFGATYYKDYQDALQYGDFDAVIVCSENVHHAEMVVAAAEAHKHILCEKPLATTIADANAMITACEKNDVKLQTAFPIRFSTPLQYVKKQIDSGSLGRILALTGTNRGQNPGGWFNDMQLSGGGAVLDHTVHVIDIMRWYIGSEIAEVYAEVDRRFSDSPVDDCGLLVMEFCNGVIASHDPSWSRPKTFPTWGDVTLRVTGTDGITLVNAFGQHYTQYDDELNMVRQVPWGDNPDLEMINGFIACITNNSSPLASGTDGMRAMEVALAAYESARIRRPVSLPLS